MGAVDRVMNFLRFPVFIALLSRVRRISANAATAAGAAITAALTTARFRAGAGRRRWQKLVARRPDRGAPRLRFWLKLAWQTLKQRDVLPLSQEVRDPYRATGLENIPAEGTFALAVNHTMRRWTPRVLATIHHATLERRPELARQWLVIVGYREARLQGRPGWAQWLILRVRRFYGWIYRRWSHNVLRLPMAPRAEEADRASIQALREWRTRARQQPSIVFPEGRGAATFEEIRPGAGRMLASLKVPVLPVSVWWDEEAKFWRLVFGPPVEWAANPRLHDLQLGLEIAVGLPPELAPAWQEALAQWAEAHQPAPAEPLETASVN